MRATVQATIAPPARRRRNREAADPDPILPRPAAGYRGWPPMTADVRAAWSRPASLTMTPALSPIQSASVPGSSPAVTLTAPSVVVSPPAESKIETDAWRSAIPDSSTRSGGWRRSRRSKRVAGRRLPPIPKASRGLPAYFSGSGGPCVNAHQFYWHTRPVPSMCRDSAPRLFPRLGSPRRIRGGSSGTRARSTCGSEGCTR